MLPRPSPIPDELCELGEGDKWVKPHVARGRFAPEGGARGGCKRGDEGEQLEIIKSD